MEYRQLGRSGLRVSAIGLGTNQFGGKVDQAGVNNIVDGAIDLGIADRTGSLTPGKRADLILVRTRDVNIAPSGDPYEALVSFAQPRNVDTVIAEVCRGPMSDLATPPPADQACQLQDGTTGWVLRIEVQYTF